MNSDANSGFLSTLSDDEVMAFRQSGAFDEQWYLNQYPDVAQSGIDPARHFLWIGRRLNRKPSANDGNASAKPISAVHAVASEPTASAQEVAVKTADASAVKGLTARLRDKSKKVFARKPNGLDPQVVRLVEEHFDEDYYLSAYPDVDAAGVDPVEHYLQNGWLEGRDPCLAFSTKYYLDNNPDIVAAKVNPFYHYLVAGKAEGREGKHRLGFRWDILSRLQPVADQIAHYKSFRIAVPTSPSDKLVEPLQTILAGARKVVLSFSHDDFTKHLGGVQILLRRELGLLNARGDAQLHFYPVHSLPFIDTSGEPVALGVLINGKDAGTFTARDIATAFAKVKLDQHPTTFVVHSLLGHAMDDAIAIITAAGATSGFLWLHDYSPIYNNFKLLRNDVAYDGFPKPGTLARELCEYARADFSHADEFAKLLGRFDVELLAPSDAALEIWRDAGVLTARSERVVNHVTLREVSRAGPDKAIERPLRVGFLGYPADHKGWAVFQELVLQMAEDPRFEFYHLGKERRGGLPLHHREVVATDAEPDLMRKAVAAAKLDVAFMWSIWPETFCLAAYEALAGGAALLTNPDSGNVARLVEQTGEGLVLADEAALLKAFTAGDVTGFARSSRTVRHFAMDYSAVTLEVMD